MVVRDGTCKYNHGDLTSLGLSNVEGRFMSKKNDLIKREEKGSGGRSRSSKSDMVDVEVRAVQAQEWTGLSRVPFGLIHLIRYATVTRGH